MTARIGRILTFQALLAMSLFLAALGVEDRIETVNQSGIAVEGQSLVRWRIVTAVIVAFLVYFIKVVCAVRWHMFTPVKK
jgi:uncharacterized membrane protein